MPARPDEIHNSSLIGLFATQPHEELVTRRLETALEEIRGQGWRDEVQQVDPAEAAGVLARFVHDLVEPFLAA